MKFLTPEYIKENMWLTEFSQEFDLERYNNEDTLRIEFEATRSLEREVDRLRVEGGFRPLFNGDDCDLEAWYNFFATITETELKDMYAETEYAEDYTCYNLELDDETRKLLFDKVVDIVGEEKWKEIWE